MPDEHRKGETDLAAPGIQPPGEILDAAFLARRRQAVTRQIDGQRPEAGKPAQPRRPVQPTATGSMDKDERRT